MILRLLKKKKQHTHTHTQAPNSDMSCHKKDTTSTSLKKQHQVKAWAEKYQASLLANPEKRSKRAESLTLTAAKPANRAKKFEINHFSMQHELWYRGHKLGPRGAVLP